MINAGPSVAQGDMFRKFNTEFPEALDKVLTPLVPSAVNFDNIGREHDMPPLDAVAGASPALLRALLSIVGRDQTTLQLVTGQFMRVATADPKYHDVNFASVEAMIGRAMRENFRTDPNQVNMIGTNHPGAKEGPIYWYDQEQLPFDMAVAVAGTEMMKELQQAGLNPWEIFGDQAQGHQASAFEYYINELTDHPLGYKMLVKYPVKVSENGPTANRKSVHTLLQRLSTVKLPVTGAPLIEKGIVRGEFTIKTPYGLQLDTLARNLPGLFEGTTLIIGYEDSPEVTEYKTPLIADAYNSIADRFRTGEVDVSAADIFEAIGPAQRKHSGITMRDITGFLGKLKYDGRGADIATIRDEKHVARHLSSVKKILAVPRSQGLLYQGVDFSGKEAALPDNLKILLEVRNRGGYLSRNELAGIIQSVDPQRGTDLAQVKRFINIYLRAINADDVEKGTVTIPAGARPAMLRGREAIRVFRRKIYNFTKDELGKEELQTILLEGFSPLYEDGGYTGRRAAMIKNAVTFFLDMLLARPQRGSRGLEAEEQETPRFRGPKHRPGEIELD